MSKRILIISDSIFRQTGYSTVANNIIKYLDPTFEVAQLGLSHIPMEYNENIKIHYYSPILNHSKCCQKKEYLEYYNPITNELKYICPTENVEESNEIPCKIGNTNQMDPYCFESAYFVIQHFKPDVVITINDIWGMYKYIALKNRQNFKLVAYLAVDSECFPAIIKSNEVINTMQYLVNVDKIIVFTNWAKETINRTAKIVLQKELDNIEIIPHGVDNSIFFNIMQKDKLINDFYKLDPKKIFLIGSVNRNQPRKRLDAIFQILRTLIDKYEKPEYKKFMVHFHCAIEDSHGWDLQWLSAYYGVQDRIILDKNLKPGVGVPDNILNAIINTYDVHLVPTNSEGWGLSILETMSCGIPNVISDYSAHSDWTKNAALKIKLAAKIHEPITNHIKGIIDIEHAAELINSLYTNYDLVKQYRKLSFELSQKLQWKNVGKIWNDLLNNIDLSNLKVDRYNSETSLFADYMVIPVNSKIEMINKD